jgi:hypothetical protein
MIRKTDANKIVNILWYFFTLMYFYEISIVGALRFNLLSVFIFENKKNYEKKFSKTRCSISGNNVCAFFY